MATPRALQARISAFPQPDGDRRGRTRALASHFLDAAIKNPKLDSELRVKYEAGFVFHRVRGAGPGRSVVGCRAALSTSPEAATKKRGRYSKIG